MQSFHDRNETTIPLLSELEAMETDSVIVSSSPPLTATDMDDHSEHNIPPPPAYTLNYSSSHPHHTAANTTATTTADATATQPTTHPAPMGYTPPPKMSLLSLPQDSNPGPTAPTPVAINCCSHTDNFTHACAAISCCGSASRVTHAFCGLSLCASESLLRTACCLGLNCCSSESLLERAWCVGVNCCGSRSRLDSACCGVNCCGSESRLARSCVVVDLCGSRSLVGGRTWCAIQCCDPEEEEREEREF